MAQRLVLMALIFPFFSLANEKKTLVHSVSKAEMLLLRRVDQRYQKEHGIHITLKKTITLGMLGTTKESEGEVWLNKGQMRLEIHKPDPSQIVAGDKFLWIESPPPPGFDGAKTQVLRASLNSDQAKSQGLIQLLTKGGVLKYFRVSGVQRGDGNITFFLQPDKQSIEFKRVQIKVKIATKEILTLRYWDQVDNETTFDFVTSEFNKRLDKKLFTYKPPKGAEVITY